MTVSDVIVSDGEADVDVDVEVEVDVEVGSVADNDAEVSQDGSCSIYSIGSEDEEEEEEEEEEAGDEVNHQIWRYFMF